MNVNKVYHGDCLEIMKTLPDKSIDLILTDPPYELDNHGAGRNSIFIKNTKLVYNPEHLEFTNHGFDYEHIFNEFIRITKTVNILIFCSNKQISKIMNWWENKKYSTTLLVWHKTNPTPMTGGHYISDLEFMVYIRGKGARFNNLQYSDLSKVYKYPTTNNKIRFHPTQKNLELITRILRVHSNENDTVLDPFAGSGTTGIACMNTDRKYILMEKEEKYYNIIVDRINKKLEQQKINFGE